jgi:hypothetical protein
MDDDDPHLTAVLEACRRELDRTEQRLNKSLRRRLQAMKLSVDQEIMLISLLTLPEDALGLVKEHLGIIPKQK